MNHFSRSRFGFAIFRLHWGQNTDNVLINFFIYIFFLSIVGPKTQEELMGISNERFLGVELR
jgi:hypothetical protein